MNRKQRSSAILGAAALLAAGGVPAGATGAATQESTSSAMVCMLRLGSVDAAGNLVSDQVAAERPPTVSSDGPNLPVYQAGKVRLSSSVVVKPAEIGIELESYVVIGDAMYRSFSRTGFDGRLDPKHPPQLTRVGGGWGTFVAFERSVRSGYSMMYGLRGDGAMFRWTVRADGVWHRAGSIPAYGGFKSMALISKTPTYDTFLMNTHSGALFTRHLPVSSPLTGVVKMVRERTWQGFESLVAERCGSYGTLLVGIDKDTHTGYLYAVGHANGFATVIQLIGKVPASLADPAYFRVTSPSAVPPYGE